MSAIGPDVWSNAPSGDSPVDEIVPWLGQMKVAAEGWKEGIKANADSWESKIDVLVTQIDGLAAVIDGDVFLSNVNRASYDVVCGAYQSLKDSLTLSPDFYLSQWQQNLNKEGTPENWITQLLDKLAALLRTMFGAAGVVIGGAIVIVVAYLYLTRRK